MSVDFNKDYNIIIKTLENKNSLLAFTQDGHFKEVGFMGRAWRVIVGKLTKQNTFEDCYAAAVGNKIVEFARKNKEILTPEQKEELISELKSLRGRLRKNYTNLTFNIEALDAIQLKTGQSKPKEGNVS